MAETKITLFDLLAHEAVGPSRRLLISHGKADAHGHADLSDKLASLYEDSADKRAIEKELAEIHPHKVFILNNLAGEKEKEEVEPVVISETSKAKNVFVHEGYLNCEGNPDCKCHEKTSGACGCSGADGGQEADKPKSTSIVIRPEYVLVSAIAIVAISAIAIHYKKA